MQNYSMFLMNTVWQYNMATCQKEPETQSFKSTAGIYKPVIDFEGFFVGRYKVREGISLRMRKNWLENQALFH